MSKKSPFNGDEIIRGIVHPIPICTKSNDALPTYRFGELKMVFEGKKKWYALAPKELFSDSWDGTESHVKEIEKQVVDKGVVCFTYTTTNGHQHDILYSNVDHGEGKCFKLGRTVGGVIGSEGMVVYLELDGWVVNEMSKLDVKPLPMMDPVAEGRIKALELRLEALELQHKELMNQKRGLVMNNPKKA